MFGINDPWIWGSYFVGLAGVVFCVVYGYIHRNDEDQEDDDE